MIISTKSEADYPYSFTLFGRPATKKNSAVLIGKGNKTPAMLPSKAYREYEANCREQLQMLKYSKGLPHYTCPVSIKVLYYLPTRQWWPDRTGLMQATADIISDDKKTLTRYVLGDDRIIKDWNGTKIAGLDKNLPRAEVTITPIKTTKETELDPEIIRAMKAKEQMKHDNGKRFKE